MRYLVTIFCLAILFFSCSKNDEVIHEGDCPDQLNCTEVYITIAIEIKDANGKPFLLDDYYTIKKSTGEKFDLTNAEYLTYQQEKGMYTLFNDGLLEKTTKLGSDFEFVGERNGKVVVRKDYTIGHDCCHVLLKKGEKNIVVSE